MSGVTYAPVDRLVEVLGVPGALKFAERFGGNRVYVPQPERLKPEGVLVATLGFEAAQKLAFEWRGMEIMVPKCRDYLARAMARAIHADEATMSRADIARKYGVSERRVFQILAAPAPAEPAGSTEAAPSAQRSLFSEG